MLGKVIVRLILSVILIAAIAIIVFGAGSVWQNNRDVDSPGRTELVGKFDESVTWLLENEEAVMEVPNPILWYMLQRAAEITSDQRLQRYFSTYIERYIEPARYDHKSPWSKWVPMFEVGRWAPVKYEDVNGLPYYNKHFLYAITCDEQLGSYPDIAEQNEPDFCGDAHVLKPTCVTHQLMGIRFLQRANCADQKRWESVRDNLLSQVVKELVYDPRVVDVYIQRVMMLLESDRQDLVKPVWVRRVLDAQLPDGGWGNFRPLLPVGGGQYLGYGHGGSRIGVPAGEGRFHFRGISVGQPISTFHATAQVVLMLALLI